MTDKQQSKMFTVMIPIQVKKTRSSALPKSKILELEVEAHSEEEAVSSVAGILGNLIAENSEWI